MIASLRDRSVLLPGLDLDELLTFLDRRTMTDCMRDYRDALRKQDKKRRRKKPKRG